MSILVNVVNQKMYVSSTMEGIVSGSQQFVKFRFNLSEEWDGLLTFAQFRQNGKAYNQYLDEENAAYLPPEIGVGTFTLMLYGSHNTTIGTTNYLTLKVNENNFISDASSTDISETLYNQLVARVQAFEETVENIKSTSAQISPEFANNISECTDMSKLYVLPDGYIYAYMIGEGQKEESSFGTTSWDTFSPISNPENAYVFNHIGASLSGSLKSISVKCDGALSTKFAVAHMNNGVVTSVDDIYITTKVGENTYVNGVDFYYEGTIQEGDLIGYCLAYRCVIYYGKSENEWCYKTNSLTDYTLTAKSYGFALSAVVETSGEAEYMWTNTGHAFVPADNEDRIIALEEDVADLKKNGTSGTDETLEVIGTEIDPSIANYADSEKFVIRVTPSTADATLTMEKSEDVNTSAVRQICYVDFTNGKIGFFKKCADGAAPAVYQKKAISFPIVSGHEYVVEMIKEDSKYAILRITDALSLETDEISCSEFEVGRGWGSRKYDYTGDAGDITSVKSYIMQQKKTKLLIVGDSYIEGSSLPEFGEDRNNRYAMLLKNAVGGDCFINGRGGAASADMLGWFNTYLPDVCQPEYTIVSCGGNDGNYDNWVARYNAIIAKIEEMGSKPILTTVAAIGVGACKDIFGQMNEWIRNRGYDYIDVNLVTSLNYEGTELNPEYVFSDNVHPNSVGHDIIFKRAQIDVPYIFRNNSQTASREYVDKALGDVDAALDSIIALQNHYIGGATE